MSKKINPCKYCNGTGIEECRCGNVGQCMHCNGSGMTSNQPPISKSFEKERRSQLASIIVGKLSPLAKLEAIENLYAKQISEAEKYHELLYQVGNKYDGESRHETALRYIRMAENQDNQGVKENLTQDTTNTNVGDRDE